MAGWGRRFRIAIQGKDPRTGQAVHLAFLSGAAGRRRLVRPATAGPAPANGSPPAASSSAASKSPRCAFRCSSAATNSAPIPAATGKYRGGPGGIVEMVVETAEPALGNTAGDGVRYGACGILGGEDGVPHRYTLLFRGTRAARDQAPRKSASKSGPAIG